MTGPLTLGDLACRTDEKDAAVRFFDTAAGCSVGERHMGETGASTSYEAAGRSGALPPSLRRITGSGVVVGRALTVDCVRGDNLAVHRAIPTAKPGDVLVVAGHGAEVGYLGEILATAAMYRGIRGAVVDGGVRDIDAVGTLGFGFWATALVVPRPEWRRSARPAPSRRFIVDE